MFLFYFGRYKSLKLRPIAVISSWFQNRKILSVLFLPVSFGRIKHNEREIQAKKKMCTGVSLAQYFNRKLNTDDRCHWG